MPLTLGNSTIFRTTSFPLSSALPSFPPGSHSRFTKRTSKGPCPQDAPSTEEVAVAVVFNHASRRWDEGSEDSTWSREKGLGSLLVAGGQEQSLGWDAPAI